MYWIFEKYVADVMKVRKICKRCTESEKNMLEMYWLWENNVREHWISKNYVADVLNVRKICKRCTESQKIV